MGSLNGRPPPFQRDASGTAVASTLQAGDVNNAFAQAQLFLPRRRFSQQFALAVLLYRRSRRSLFSSLLPFFPFSLLSLARVRE